MPATPAAGSRLATSTAMGYLISFSAERLPKSKLYKNLGDFRFEDVTSSADVAGGDVWSTGAAMVDIDGDQDLDLYVCNYDAPNYLYINDGKGRFTEQAAKFGAGDPYRQLDGPLL